MALHYLTHQVQVMLSLLACFPLSSSKNWISSLVPSLDKLFLISFNVPLRYPNTFSWFHLTYHCTPQIHFLDFINRTIALPKYIFYAFFFVLFRDTQSGTERFRLVLDVHIWKDRWASVIDRNLKRQIVSWYVWTSLVFYGTGFYWLSTLTTVHCYYIPH